MNVCKQLGLLRVEYLNVFNLFKCPYCSLSLSNFFLLNLIFVLITCLKRTLTFFKSILNKLKFTSSELCDDLIDSFLFICTVPDSYQHLLVLEPTFIGLLFLIYKYG